ncbi:MAG: VWA domain-containing protein [Deltaproteobacteria bacterium]|jgi:uncharacterized protein YegL|nr:VWA domain-containing protein [Deltaproteobacteria bacterium]
MRRLPVYLVIDVSGSMTGEPIEAVKNGIQTMLSALRKDPQAVETAYLGLISFSDTISSIPLTELSSFQPPKLVASGGTALGGALSEVTKAAALEVNKGSQEEKGDWKPLVFLMTDGMPTDNVDKGIAEFKAFKWGTVVACAAGSGADTKLLSRITEIVVSLDTCDTNSIQAFFKWVSSSISVTSKRIETGAQPDQISQLPPPPQEINLLKF